jgi:hypothetical protein
MGLATFWASFSQTHLVTLVQSDMCRKLISQPDYFVSLFVQEIHCLFPRVRRLLNEKTIFFSLLSIISIAGASLLFNF